MAKIGKIDETDVDNNKSIDELKQEFVKQKGIIGEALKNIKDRADLSIEQKGQLRKLYSRASNLAKMIADRSIGEAEREKFLKAFSVLAEEAGRYGSTIKPRIPKTTFDDVKGLDNVKEIVKSFVFMADNPQILKYYKIEGNLGMLMYGAPGTGKTMFAEAIANAMQLPLFIITPADIYKSYVGESEQAVKLIFQEIEACEDGAILFIDECESIFSKRQEGTKDYKAAVTTELLQRINGFGGDGTKRIMIAATNRPDEIDPAYLRYKRFSYQVHIEPPDGEARRAIISSKIKGIELEPGLDADYIFSKTDNLTKMKQTSVGTVTERCYYSAADICGIIEEACRLAITQIQDSGLKTHIPLTKEMFDKAFAGTPPSISDSLLNFYRNFKDAHSKK